MEALQRQRADIDNQISMMNQQMGQQPPIQQTFITNPQPQATQGMQYDFGCKWVASKEAAQSMAKDSPLLFLNENKSEFYMNDPKDGFVTYSFQRVVEAPKSDTQSEDIQILKNQIAQQNQAIQSILAYLNPQASKNATVEQKQPEQAVMAKKQASKKQTVTKEESENV